jgi:hypothetical protein
VKEALLAGMWNKGFYNMASNLLKLTIKLNQKGAL